MKHRTPEEWSEIIFNAYSSNTSLRSWCLENQIRFDTFCDARRRLLARGKLGFLREKIFLGDKLTDAAYVEFPLEKNPGFLVLEPIRSNLSVESMAAIVWFDLGLPLQPGQVFFFISTNRKQVFALRICENGYCLLTRKLEKGRFPWPNYGDSDAPFLYRFEYEKIAQTLLI